MNIFVQVADAGNFSKVARERGLSTSVVSKYVAVLEDQLGVRLLNRTTRSLSLTEIGADYLRRCRQILDHVEDANRSATSLQVEPRGLLRINAPMSFGILHLGSLTARFIERYPDVEIDLELNDRFIDVVDEGFDIAIRSGELEDTSLIARKLTPVRRICCGSPDYIKSHGLPLHPRDLAHHKGLYYGHRGWVEEWNFIGSDGEFQSEAPVIMKSNNGDVLKAAAVAGAGLVTMPTFITWDEVKSGRLVPILPDYQTKDLGLYAAYPPTRNLSAKVRVFIDFLKDTFGSKPYWDEPFGD
jgi:DNA-binding transcriptional LysR family regulator